MIARFRSTHRWIWLALAILLPTLLFFAVRARTALPIQELPPALAPAAQPSDDAP
ncbi:MAG: hypothetical protein KBA72_02865 [Thermoanaerobaculia bacterium]|nr:hypothetical protein [Thermoanaerobaculia bacterium]